MSKSEDICNARLIDRICDEFEENWSTAGGQLDSYLAKVDESERARLLQKLIEVDLELRTKNGQQLAASDYQHLGDHAVSIVIRLLDNDSHTRSIDLRDRTNDFTSSTTSELETLPSGTDEQRIVQTPVKIGRYQIQQVLGKGGFGLVYLAYDDQLDRQVAVKVPHAHLVSTGADAQACLTEARTVANLDHPNIVPVYDVGQTDDFPCYVVSKYIEGMDLATKIRKQQLKWHKTAELVASVAEALHYAHKQGLVHRDVKPRNILLDSGGTPYVVDFGLALKEQDIGKGPGHAGTPAYMSPEQARGEGHCVDGRSDIYSLGAVFYELLTNRRTFIAETRSELLQQISSLDVKPPRQVDDSAPRELERICLKALSKRVGERYTTALDMADELRQFLEENSADYRSATHSAKATHDAGMHELGDTNPLLKPFWRFIDDDLRQILVVAATLAQLECKNYVSTTNFVKALMILKPGRISEFFSKLPDGALPETIPADIPIELSALQSLGSFSPCINSAISNLTPEICPEKKLSSEDVYIDIARFAKGKSTQQLRSHGVSKPDVEKIVGQLGWHLVERKTAINE